MKTHNYQAQALIVDFILRFALLASGIVIIGYIIAGCSSESDRTRSLDLAVKGSYTPGSLALTRNQPPQGGIDEKSGVTPTQSLE